jgi:hypothetical protein
MSNPKTAVAALVACVALAVTAPLAAAHVNRTVGPYTILVVLVEEPVYADNHAGFQFWVRRNEVPILGLEQSITAVATGHDQRIALAVPKIDGTGFYVLDHAVDGAAFDPDGGGAWTLELSGSIDGTPLDASFPVTFPSYPRIGTTAQAPAAQAAGTPSASLDSLPVIAAGGFAVAGLLGLFMVTRRRRPRGSAPA